MICLQIRMLIPRLVWYPLNHCLVYFISSRLNLVWCLFTILLFYHLASFTNFTTFTKFTYFTTFTHFTNFTTFTNFTNFTNHTTLLYYLFCYPHKSRARRNAKVPRRLKPIHIHQGLSHRVPSPARQHARSLSKVKFHVAVLSLALLGHKKDAGSIIRGALISSKHNKGGIIYNYFSLPLPYKAPPIRWPIRTTSGSICPALWPLRPAE